MSERNLDPPSTSIKKVPEIERQNRSLSRTSFFDNTREPSPSVSAKKKIIRRKRSVPPSSNVSIDFMFEKDDEESV